jgi:uncharacterized protein (TIGR03000 family)
MLRKALSLAGLLLLAGATVLATPGFGRAQYLGVRKPYADGRNADIILKVPAGARVWFNGVPTTATGAVRVFHTPPLAPETQYFYDVRARWIENGREVTQEQQVAFRAGAEVRVYFPIPPMINGHPLDTPDF